MNSIPPIRARVVVLLMLASLVGGPLTPPRAVAADSKKESAKWVALSGCQFLPTDANDGDSFHVIYGRNEFIFRLYFVDTPETDKDLKERINEQAEYFGVSAAQVMKAGEEARKFTASVLRRPFKVTTRWQNAMGRSRLPRNYAQIEVSGVDLGELLVCNGWGRAKGTLATLPDGTRAKDHMEKLDKLEAEAKAKRVGLWASSKKK